MQFLGLFHHPRTACAQSITNENFLSLGMNAVSGKDVLAEGGTLALVCGCIRNREALAAFLQLPINAPAAALLINAYRLWGADYPRHIEGSAATAILDRVEDRMILTRDRAGAIPVYFSWHGRTVTFAGKIRYLHHMNAAGHAIGIDSLNALFALSHLAIPGRTPFSDVRALEPGCAFISDARGTRTRRYYALPDSDRSLKSVLEDTLTGLPADENAAMFSDVSDPSHASSDASDNDLFSMFLDRRHLTAQPISPSELEDLSEDAFIEAIGDATYAIGMPCGLSDVTHLLIAQHTSENCRYLITDAGRSELTTLPPCPQMLFDAHPLTRFLRPALKEAMNPAAYAQNRLREALDRLPIDPKMDDDTRDVHAVFTIACAYILPALAARRSVICTENHLTPIMPWLDERVLSVLKSSPRVPSASDSSVVLPAAAQSGLRWEALRIAQDDTQPIHALIDAQALMNEAKSDRPDIEALTRLISINFFLMQNEAEIRL